MEQMGLFDFLDEQELEKPKDVYYISKEDLESQFIDGYTLGYHYEWTVQKPNYKGENFIGLLPNNRVYKNGFIYQFKTEKEAKQLIVDTYQKRKDSFDRMKADKESYPVVEYDNKPRVRKNLYLLTEPVKQHDGSQMIFSEHWYSGLNGYFYTLTLPYEDKMDLQGRILYQKDKIENVSWYINRDLKDKRKAPIFYTYIQELMERCDYLVNELGYNNPEYMATLPDLEMLEQMYEKHEKEREIYLKEHPIVKQKMDVEYEEISSHLFDAVDWQYPDTLFDEWIDGNEINKIGNKYIFTAGMELNDFLKMEYLKDFQQGNVNILGVDGKKYISLEDLVNFDVDRYSEKCLNVVYENEKRESQMQEKNHAISFQFGIRE